MASDERDLDDEQQAAERGTEPQGDWAKESFPPGGVLGGGQVGAGSVTGIPGRTSGGSPGAGSTGPLEEGEPASGQARPDEDPSGTVTSDGG